MSLAMFLLVGVGGALGALCRHKALTFLKPKAQGHFPWPTLLVNLVSCTVAGAALAASFAMGQMAYTALTMGFLGGFSTLSTMNCEAVDLAVEGRRGLAVGYLAATYLLTLGVAGAGFAAASAMF